MKRISTACFTGHRPTQLPFLFRKQSDEYRRLSDFIDYYIMYLNRSRGVTTFISGMALGVDMLAAERVIALRDAGAPIQLVCAIPCDGQASRWNREDREKYNALCKAANDVIYVGHEYTKDCMIARNRFMIKSSSCCIAVWNGEVGGTSSTVRLARKDKLHICRLDPTDFSISIEDGDPELGLFDM
jgi:uncharacterized phage-like protein YoqJ